MFSQEEIVLAKELDTLELHLEESLRIYNTIQTHRHTFKDKPMNEVDRQFVVDDINNNLANFVIEEDAISLESYGHDDAIEATGRDLMEIAKRVGKAILKILDRMLDVAKRFFNKRLSMAAIREREAKRAMEEITKLMPDLQDEAKRFTPTTVAAVLFDKNTGNLFSSAELSSLARDLKDNLNPTTLQSQTGITGSNLMDLSLKTPLLKEDLKQVHDQWWTSVMQAYDMKQRETPSGIVASKRVNDLPIVFKLETTEDNEKPPTAKLEMMELPSIKDVDGLTPSDAIIALTSVRQILNVAKEVNDIVPFERSFKTLMGRVKDQMRRPAENTELILNQLPKWNSLGIQASRKMSDYQYRVALGIMSYVASSRKTWTVR